MRIGRLGVFVGVVVQLTKFGEDIDGLWCVGTEEGTVVGLNGFWESGEQGRRSLMSKGDQDDV